MMTPYQGYSLGSAFKDFFKRYTDFSGRSTRSAYWFWQLASFLINILVQLLYLVVGMMAVVNENIGGGLAILLIVLSILWSLVIIIPNLALSVRRLHDIGKSGWNLFLPLIPVLVFVVCSVLCVEASESTANVLGVVIFVSVLALVVTCIMLFVYTVLDSQKGTNKWGPSEKYPDLDTQD